MITRVLPGTDRETFVMIVGAFVHWANNVGLIFEYRMGPYYEPFPQRLRLPKPTLPLEYVFIRIRSTHCGGAPESG